MINLHLKMKIIDNLKLAKLGTQFLLLDYPDPVQQWLKLFYHLGILKLKIFKKQVC